MNKYLILTIIMLSIVGCNKNGNLQTNNYEKYSNRLFYVKLQSKFKNEKEIILFGSDALVLVNKNRNLPISLLLKNINGSVININSAKQYEIFSLGEIEFDKKIDQIYKQHGIAGLIKNYCKLNGTIHGGGYCLKLMLMNGIKVWSNCLGGSPFIKFDEFSKLLKKYNIRKSELQRK